MRYEYALRTADNYIIDDITRTGILPDGCTKYYNDNIIRLHESGSPLYKIVNDNIIELTQEELASEEKYIEWHNANIKVQLRELDISRIRPSAEINDDYTTSQEKQDAKANLKTLNEQAKALRDQLL